MYGASSGRRGGNWLRRNPLTVAFYLAVLTLVVASCYGLYDLLDFTRRQEVELEHQRLQADVESFVAGLQSDEGALIRYNLGAFLDDTRKFTPLVSPKRYYTAEPLGEVPAQMVSPPRSCFVRLGGQAEDSVSACAYVVQGSGWLYVHLGMRKPRTVFYSDAAMHDAITIAFAGQDGPRAWRLSFLPIEGDETHFGLRADALPPPGPTSQAQPPTFQGWAHMAAGGTLNAQLRIRLDALGEKYAAERRAAVWPPSITSAVLRLSRTDVVDAELVDVVLPEGGTPQLTLRDLYDLTVTTRARVSIEDDSVSPARVVWSYQPDEAPPSERSAVRPVIASLLARGGTAVSEHIPETAYAAIAVKSGLPVNSAVARALGWMTLLVLLLLALVFLFGLYVMRPVRRMARSARMLAVRPLATDQLLPFANQRTELGTLARAFNLVLRNWRSEAERRLLERQQREEEQRTRMTEEVRLREKHLRMIGHEIRSPLQALLSFHPPGDPGRRYVDRVMRALDHLYGRTSAEAAFNSATLELQRADVAAFLREVACNAPRAGIAAVEYEGPTDPVMAVFDSTALEDAVAHILNNANRYRNPGTPIVIALRACEPGASTRADRVRITITNEGPQIPPSMLEKVFEYGVSDGKDSTSEGQGLFVAQNYVRKMGGSIRAYNAEGAVALELDLLTAVREV